MLQGIGATLVFFGLFPVLIWGLTALLKLNPSASQVLKAAGGAYLAGLIGVVAYVGMQNVLSHQGIGPYLASAVGFVVLIALNCGLAKTIFKATWTKSIVTGVATSIVLTGTAFASLVILLKGVSFC